MADIDRVRQPTIELPSETGFLSRQITIGAAFILAYGHHVHLFIFIPLVRCLINFLSSAAFVRAERTDLSDSENR